MSTNLAVITENEFQIATMSEETASAIKEELCGLGPISFDTIKIPSGGGLAFEIPSDDPDRPETVNEIKCVILHHHAMNAYWPDSYDGENTPPTCMSMDGVSGLERETGEVKDCSSCPYNAFGSAKNGGKACKNMRRLYILREGEMLPSIINLPPTSIKGYSGYLVKKIIGKKYAHSYDVLTKITLKKEKNSGGITYSKAEFALVGALSEEQLANVLPSVQFVFSVKENVNDLIGQFGDGASLDVEYDDELPFGN